MSTSKKVYVAVMALFDPQGKISPQRLRFEDGRVFQIDRILDVRPAAALKAGGQGDRYTIQVKGKSAYLFFERKSGMQGTAMGRWFVERK